jgi:DNA-binding MarR family transcriptional regulator
MYSATTPERQIDRRSYLSYRGFMLDFAHAARKMAMECPAFRVRQASRVLARIYDDELRPLGLQLSQLPILTVLSQMGDSGASMNTLAQALVMDPTTLTRNVKPLEKAGFIRVARSPDDRRTRVVLMTRSGERTLEAAFPLWERATKRVRIALGRDRLEQLHARLGEIIAIAAPEQPRTSHRPRTRASRRRLKGL